MNSHGKKTVPLKRSRFSNLSHEGAIALLNKFEGPWLEIVLSQDSADICSGDVLGEVMMTFYSDPAFLALIPSNEEYEAWERFKRERGDGPKEIGDFVYGPGENPWR